MDRQHPRDWFDVMLLDENEGITAELQKAFLVYLISHPRPMEELLAPNWKQQESLFEGEFRGMAFREVTLEALRRTMETVLARVLSMMTREEKRFLCSLYEGEPQWRLLGLEGVMSLPAIKWKLQNISKMNSVKRAASLQRLRQILGRAE
ncbi:MAG: nucleotidyl transferase AbiEii/AbiGii toxin family protein [Marinobacter sp.]